MFRHTTKSEILSRFRHLIRPLLIKSDKQGIKRTFVELTALACMSEGEPALEHMETELRAAFEEPHRSIRRDLFPRL